MKDRLLAADLAKNFTKESVCQEFPKTAAAHIKGLSDLVKEQSDEIERLIEHVATLSIGLRDDDTDAPTEHWRSLPDHLQEAINAKTEWLDIQSEIDAGRDEPPGHW